MTRIQEISWVGELEVNQNEIPALENPASSRRVNLYRLPWLRAALQSRWPQFTLRFITLVGFAFTVSSAIIGSRVGSHNFAIIMVWIAWWTTLKLGFIPLGGRSWCSICPIALPGDWLQQRGIFTRGKRRLGLGLRWPKKLRASWLQSGGFLLIGLFAAVTLTDPRITGWVLLAVLGLAISMSLVFEKRAFCSYLCPIGGFSGMYAKAAPVEVQVIDKDVCKNHTDKSCYRACPWGIYPVAMRDASACGLCMECLRACPHDNLALNLRPYGTDLGKPLRASHLDEPLLALVMLGSVLAFSAVFLGPWGWLKLSAFNIGSTEWVLYTAGFLVLNLFFLPAAFISCVWIAKRMAHSSQSITRLVASQSQALLPLGLMAWIAFTISFALPKLTYILGVLNDPFGWGWHLLGVFRPSTTLDVSGFSPILQVLILIIGLFWGARVALKQSRALGSYKIRNNLPLLVFCLTFSMVMVWLLVG
jgi:ferredoxin